MVNLRPHGYRSDVLRECAVSVPERLGENIVLSVQGTLVGIRGVGCGSVHLVIPSLLEEGLSDMQNGTGVRNESAEVKG